LPPASRCDGALFDIYLVSETLGQRDAALPAVEHERIARPANMTVVTALTRPEMKVEIEITAFRG
jgi:enamine deaminase RidA (YjgF/YER057c/UK114 family)